MRVSTLALRLALVAVLAYLSVAVAIPRTSLAPADLAEIVPTTFDVDAHTAALQRFVRLYSTPQQEAIGEGFEEPHDETDDKHSEHSPLEQLIHIAHKTHVVTEFAEKLDHWAHHNGIYEKLATQLQGLKSLFGAYITQLRAEFAQLDAMSKVVALKAQIQLGLQQAKAAISKGLIKPGTARYTELMTSIQEFEQTLASESKAFYKATQYLRHYANKVGAVQQTFWAKLGTLYNDVKAAVSASEAATKMTKGVTESFKLILGRAKAIPFKNILKGMEGFLGSSGKFVSSAIYKGLKTAVNPKFIRAIMVMAILAEGIQGFVDSNASTLAGKIGEGGLRAGSGALVMANPYIALADICLPEGWKLSDVYKGGAASITSLVEGLVTGDTTSMEKVNADNLSGKNGVVMKASAEAGEYWAQHGFIGGMKLFWQAVRN